MTARAVKILLAAGALALGAIPVLVWADVFSIDPQATLLRTNDDPGALNTLPIDLSALSFAVTACDFLRLNVLGDWRAGANADFTDTRKDTSGLFSSSNILLDGSNLNRVPGALAAGVGFVTDPTVFGGISNDIPQLSSRSD